MFLFNTHEVLGLLLLPRFWESDHSLSRPSPCLPQPSLFEIFSPLQLGGVAFTMLGVLSLVQTRARVDVE